ERQLMGYVLAAQRAGVPLKVAVATDGDVTDHLAMVRRPQVYARHVTRRIESQVPVIIVTPYGVGITGSRAPTNARIPPNASSDALAAVAMETVRAVASTAGHPLPAHVPLGPMPPVGSGVAPTTDAGDV